MKLPPPDRWDTMKCEPAWSAVAVQRVLEAYQKECLDAVIRGDADEWGRNYAKIVGRIKALSFAAHPSPT